MRLRDYQAELLASLQDGIAAGERRQIAVLPHGLGATTIAVALAAGGYPDGCRLLIAPSDIVIDRMAQRLATELPAPQRFAIERTQEAAPECRVVIASASTLVRRAELLIDRFARRLELVIVDDAAIAVAPETYAALQLIMRNSDASLIGLTGTTQRSDNVTLAAAFDHVVAARDVAWALDAGWLTPTTSLRRDIGTSDDDAVDAVREVAADRPTLVFVDRIERTERLAQRLRAVGVTAIAVSSNLAAQERDLAVAAYRAGDVAALVCTDLLAHLDLAETGAVVLATTSAAHGRYAQRVSRAMFPHPSIVDELGIAPDASARRKIIEGSPKPVALVIEPIDLHEQGISIAAIVGLPPRIDAQGQSIARVRERFTRLQAVDPGAADHAANIDDIERALTFADPFALPAFPQWASRLRWVPIADGYALTFPRRTAAYRRDGRPVFSLDRALYALRHASSRPITQRDALVQLDLRPNSTVVVDERLVIIENVLGGWDLYHEKNDSRLRCGAFASREAAVTAAESWSFANRARELRTLERDAPWRAEPRTRFQERALAAANVPVRRWPKSKGDARDLLTSLDRLRGTDMVSVERS